MEEQNGGPTRCASLSIEDVLRVNLARVVGDRSICERERLADPRRKPAINVDRFVSDGRRRFM
jgi:hypothetical protein